MDAWLILLPAFTLTLLMILTHTYLGLHVLARGIIFVDLALAQVAALGVSIAFLLGQEAHGVMAQLYAFAATLVAAAGFAKLRQLPGKTTREVTIGCVYVVATALSIVVLSRSSQGMEELKGLFNGHILWVRWSEITLVALVYAALAILHLCYQQRFTALSFSEDEEESGTFFWEFLFFASFAVVITLAVNLAGVLLVFAFLIIPAFSASLLSQSPRQQLLIGWCLGVCGSAAGLWLSFIGDLPTGATVVTVMGSLPLIAVAIRFILLRRVSG
ncbi:MAG: metal ABC transporter permease [Pseudomonadales bacterium]|nr:metal ABC transporter permease [Pseudomonadales bacterium]